MPTNFSMPVANSYSIIGGLTVTLVVMACASSGANSTDSRCAIGEQALERVLAERMHQGERSGAFFAANLDIATLEAIPREEHVGRLYWWRVDPSQAPSSTELGMWRPAQVPSLNRDRENPLTSTDLELLGRLRADDVRSAVGACSTIQDRLNSEGIPFGDAAKLTNSARLEDYPSMIYDLALPVVSDDGRTAIVLIGSASAPLSAQTWLAKMERQEDGSWTTTALMGLAVS